MTTHADRSGPAEEQRQSVHRGDGRRRDHRGVRDLAGLGNRATRRLLRAARGRDDEVGGRPVDGGVAAEIARRRGGGRTLPGDVRSEMEGALGADLSSVRIHEDGDADRLSRSVRAKAFTSGSDLYFARGRFNPSSRSGRELLAHELAHVVQQRQGTTGLRAGHVSTPGDAAERDAAAIGKAVAKAPRPAGNRPSGGSAATATPTVSRAPTEHEHGPGCRH